MASARLAIAAAVAAVAAASAVAAVFGVDAIGAFSNLLANANLRRQASGAVGDVPSTMTAVVAVDSTCVTKPWPVPRALAEEDVLIRVVATAINRLDTMQRRGKSPVPKGVTEVLGLEVAGVVVALGAAARGFHVGDRVMALVPGGGYAEYVSVHTATVMHKPRALSWAQAATVPEAWLTAALNLQLGRAAAGETVLIHAAASGVGVAAIQLARAAGLRVLVTVGSANPNPNPSPSPNPDPGPDSDPDPNPSPSQVGSAEKLALATTLGAAGGAIRHDGPWLETVRARTGRAPQARERARAPARTDPGPELSPHPKSSRARHPP